MDIESQRIKQTKNDLKDAFWSLYKTQKIEKITIKQITDKAGFNRGTFYVYYTDIYDLFEQIKNECLVEINEHGDEMIMLLFARKLEKSKHFILEFYLKRKMHLKKLLGTDGDPQFVHQIKKILKLKLQKHLKISPTTNNLEIDLILEYIISAHIGVTTYWLEQHCESDSPKPMIDLIQQSMWDGPLQTLQKMI